MLARYYLACMSYLRHKHKLLILSRLSDFMTCSERLIFLVRGPYLSFGTL